MQTQRQTLNVWETFASIEGWDILPFNDLRVRRAARAANGEYWQEVVEDVAKLPSYCAYHTPFGDVIFRDEGDELCVVSFNGHDYAHAISALERAAKSAGFVSWRMHTDKESILRYWRKMGIVPTEYVYRGVL